MNAAPCLSPNDLIRLRACNPNQRLAESDAAGWPRDVARPLREWAMLPSTSAPDLAWAMMRLDRIRCLRVLAAMLEAVLPPDADPRSRAVVPMLRESNRYTHKERAEVAAAAWAAAGAAEAAAWAAWAALAAAEAAAWEAWAAAEAAEAAAWAARTDLDIRAIFLSAWDQG